MTLDDFLRTQPGRCPDCGVHLASQGRLHVGGCLPTARREAVAGMARASSAHPTESQLVESAVRRLAASGKPFSANDAREIHGVRGGVVGATFNALRAEGVIRAVGSEGSNDRGTHGKAVALWIGVAA